MAGPPPVNQRIADRLLAEGKIQRGDHQRVIEYAARHKTRVEDAIIELEVMPEADLLKYVATVHGTRFVSTEKLSKAIIEPRVLSRVNRKIADMHQVFPVLFDEGGKVLSVVTPDPDNPIAMHELKLAAAVREVRALVARPAAVRAAIAFHYHGDHRAFNDVLRAAAGLNELMKDDVFDRAGKSPAPPPQLELDGPGAAAPVIPPARKRSSSTSRMLTPPVSAPIVPQGAAPSARLATPPAAIAFNATNEFIETLNVLVTLLENGRQDLRGHSSTVARLIKKCCERIGLGAEHVTAYVAAGYIHDLGKMGAYHLTPLNCAEYEGHQVAAMKAHELPVELMASVGLSVDTKNAVQSMYERYDGKGFPHGQAGKEIPLGGRILAVVDTYADLTQNPRNPYRKILRPLEACEVLAQFRGKVFDPNIVDLFRQAVTGEDMRAKLLADRHLALIVDPDPEETTVLELRMIEQGFEVKIARTAAQAKQDLEQGEVAVVISEIDLDAADAGLTLRTDAMKETWGRDVTWVFLTSKTDRTTAQKAFETGVDDVVTKPASTDIFVAKIRQLIERRASAQGGRGVSGSLAEMGLPDMVQILWHGRKTCALKIVAKGSNGEIHFAEGQIWGAQWGAARGEDAFYSMLALHEGDFRLDPNFKPTARTINASPEALLLEGMRRLDENTARP